MKYIIASVYSGDVTIEEVTDDPIRFVSGFEPIDVVNGCTIAWDEEGNLYEFGPSKELEEAKPTKNISIVEVGTWDKNEPILIRVAQKKTKDLKSALKDYLTKREQYSRKRFWRRRRKNDKNPSSSSYNQMTLKELIALVEEAMKN